MRVILALAIALTLLAAAPARAQDGEPTRVVTHQAAARWAFTVPEVARVLNQVHRPTRDAHGMKATDVKDRYVMRDAAITIFAIEGGTVTDVDLAPTTVSAAMAHALVLKRALHPSAASFGAGSTVDFSKPSERSRTMITYASREEGAGESCTLFLDARGRCYKIRYVQGC
jgi:hypothetical protein